MPSIQYLPHQSRVLDEHDELDTKLGLLDAFIKSSPVFTSLPEGEKTLLLRQQEHMGAYLDILAARILLFWREAFKKQTSITDLEQYPMGEFCNAATERAFQNWLAS